MPTKRSIQTFPPTMMAAFLVLFSLGCKSMAFTSPSKSIAPHRIRLHPLDKVTTVTNFKQFIPSNQGLFSFRIDAPIQTENVDKPNENDVEKLKDVEEKVPVTMSNALRAFFVGDNPGPILVVASIVFLSYTRLCRITPVISSSSDGIIFVLSILFWWFQEHLMHDKLLHSNFNWIGKSIHQTHHDKPYFHVSMDPPALILGWLWSVHLLLRLVLPLPLALSATIGYAIAGLFYEWTHYIVHTKVRLKKNSLFRQIRDNHIRHHCVNEKYWLSFSVPAIDDLMGTNPTVEQARRLLKKKDCV